MGGRRGQGMIQVGGEARAVVGSNARALVRGKARSEARHGRSSGTRHGWRGTDGRWGQGMAGGANGPLFVCFRRTDYMALRKMLRELKILS